MRAKYLYQVLKREYNISLLEVIININRYYYGIPNKKR
jgi:hypothetical protein